MNAANIITVFRLFAVIPFAVFLSKKSYSLAFIFFAFAGISDLIDGFIARKFNQKTKLGGYLDPMADKLLIFAANLLFVLQSVIPVWFFILTILKDLSILLGVVLLKAKRIEWEPSPNRAGKLSSFFQGILILVCITDQGFFKLPFAIPVILGICTLLILAAWFFYFKFYLKLSRNNNSSQTAQA